MERVDQGDSSFATEGRGKEVGRYGESGCPIDYGIRADPRNGLLKAMPKILRASPTTHSLAKKTASFY